MNDTQLNAHLKEAYGTTLDGQAKFRVVNTHNLTEKRFGTFTEQTSAGIFLREVTGIQEVPKYPFIKDRWVLEHQVTYANSGTLNKELGAKSGYECLYVFQDKDGKALPLNKNAADVLIYFFMNRHNHKRSASELLDEEDKKEKAKKERLKDMIGEMLRSPYFGDLVY